MKRIDKFILTATALAFAVAPVVALAAPNINGAVIVPRVFNDCPGSILVTNNAYPANIHIQDSNPNCFGFANLHNWRLSADGGATPASFSNTDQFTYCADLVLSGTGAAEAGLNITPWWSVADGRLNVKVHPGFPDDGEIAAFGGRLPFFSFTSAFGLRYVQGTPIYLRITYSPNRLSPTFPATIIYDVLYGSNAYTSGSLAFDSGNLSEDPPHGRYGILTPAEVGGHFQYFLADSGPGSTMTADFNNICYENLGAVPTLPSTWGNIKALYNN